MVGPRTPTCVRGEWGLRLDQRLSLGWDWMSGPARGMIRKPGICRQNQLPALKQNQKKTTALLFRRSLLGPGLRL